MSRPETIYLRASDAQVLESLIQSAALGRDAALAARLDEELERAIVVPDDALPPGTVALDSRVRFRDETTGRERAITLVVPGRAAPGDSRVSVLSPIGSALLGLGVHDRIEWPLPGGKLSRLRVLEVA